MKGIERHKLPVINSHGDGQERQVMLVTDGDHTHRGERSLLGTSRASPCHAPDTNMTLRVCNTST